MGKTLILLLLLSLTSTLTPTEPDERPYVTTWMKSGQLGNQLFEISAALAFAWDNDMDPIFPGLNNTDSNISINYKRIFFRLNASQLPRPIRSFFDHRYYNYEKIDIPIRPDQMLRGYFQTWEYFDHHRERILSTFAPHPDELDRIQLKHADLLQHPYTVGIHVRTFNKAWSSSIPFVGMSYYERAIRLFPDEALFVIFSDRINWCKHHFAKFDRPIIFIDDQDHIEDLFLMSMMKHAIIGNSTFSWWAAYLNQNPNKIIVAPSCYLNPKFTDRFKTKTSPNMPNWIVLKSENDASIATYPTDILDYDSFSKSLDTQ